MTLTCSVSQFAELFGVEPREFRGVAYDQSTGMVTVETEEHMQVTGTCPPLSDNTSRKPKGKGKR